MTNPPQAFKGRTTWHPECAKRRYLQHGKALRPYAAAVFKRYYGLRGERMTHREIGEEYGVSIERIRQLRREAEDALRKGVKSTYFYKGRDWRSIRRKRYGRLGCKSVYIPW